MRPAWLGHYGKHRNAGTTCRRFGISRSALYKWMKAYREGPGGPGGPLPGTEEEEGIPGPLADRGPIVAIRKKRPAWSKHKIAVILARDHGMELSDSSVGRTLAVKGMLGKIEK